MRRPVSRSNVSMTSIRAAPASTAASRRSPMWSASPTCYIWKRNLTELPALVDKVKNFYAGKLLDAARFLSDHDVSYVVWSVRESKDIDAWKSIMQAIDADYRWVEFSTTPDTHIDLWIRR